MSQNPFSVQPLPISKSILLPASFAAGGALLLTLFMALLGCGGAPFESGLPRPEPQNAQNAVLCECTCASPVDPLAVPAKNFIAVGSDDATQALIPGTAVLTGSLIELGQNGLAGVRFQSIGVPPFATITEARIQFTAGATSTAGDVSDLHIRVVDQPDAVFTAGNPPQPIDLSTLPLLNGAVDWAPGPWTTVDDAGTEQLTPDLTTLLQAIVNRNDYKPTSAVAFVIGGFGQRSARSFEGATSKPAPPYLTIKYQPLKTMTEFSACFNPDTEDPAAVCSGKVDDNVTAMAVQCKVASACTCTTKPVPDPNTFAQACNQSCGPVPLPADCNPDGFKQATQAAPGQMPVCIAQSPLGSALFGRRSACDLDPSQSGVTVTLLDDGRENGRASNQAGGRIEFAGPTCVDGSCDVAVAYRVHIGDMKFDAGPFAEDPVITELTGVGKSSGAIDITGGAGTIPRNSLEHSARGRQVDRETRAYFLDRQNPLPMNVNVAANPGGWTSGGVCTLHGDFVHTEDIVISANLRGTLVNQPPTADAGPDQQQIECNDVGRATFSLDGSRSVDPDNNVAFFGWFRGSRTGDLVGSLPRADVAQAVETRVPYVFKVIDTFGQYDDATTTVSVVDTTPPRLSVVLSPSVLWPPNHKLMRITAAITVNDVCDPNPHVRLLSIESNEPDNRRGDGNTSDDIQDAAFGTDDRSFLLRAEHSGTGAGRKYTVTYEARDSGGNATVRQATVTVPHNR
jgi:hypothetical protein